MQHGRLALALSAALAIAAPLIAQAPPRELTAAQEKELRIWSAQLTDPTTSDKTKLQAAELLLDRPYPQAAQVLIDFMNNKENRAARIAVADAVTRSPTPRTEFIDPLMGMLLDKDATIRSAGAKGLITYKNHGVVERLLAVVKDPQQDRAVRLDTMSALQTVLDKRVVGALIGLLRDGDQAIRKNALDLLPKLTNIYGYGPEQWESWWERNKDKALSEWMSEWAENLARRSRELEDENAELRRRLSKSLEDLYGAAPGSAKNALLLEMLKDGVVEVRLSATGLLERSLPANGAAPSDLVTQLRTMLDDEDARIRRTVVRLLVVVDEKQAAGPLLERLESETVSSVRQAILGALGQLSIPEALPAALRDLGSKDDALATAAALALEKIASRQTLEGQLRDEAVQAVRSRYELASRAERSKETVALVEALVRAMGTVGGQEFLGVLQEAIKDPAAMIRLAAVSSLGRVGNELSASALEALLADADRGVRRAAIVTLGALGGSQHLSTILSRTRPAAEPDAAVRQQAWEVAMSLLDKADADSIQSAADALRDRLDARDQRIRMLELLVERLRQAKDKRLPGAYRQLGSCLLQAGRAAEAAERLAQAHSILRGEQNPQADDAWLEWLDAMHASDPLAAINAMVEQESEPAFAKAFENLTARLAKLEADKQWPVLIRLDKACIDVLAPRLTVEQLVELKRQLGAAQKEQQDADRKTVAKLTADLVSPEAAVRQAALAGLVGLGERAVRPMLEHLRKIVSSDAPNAEAEKALLAALAQLAPDLKNYDVDAAQAIRLQTVDAWLKSFP